MENSGLSLSPGEKQQLHADNGLHSICHNRAAMATLLLGAAREERAG